jgi:hypothetical protein
VEAALRTWFIDDRARPLSGPVLVQALQQHDFNATSGWLSRWKTRNNIVYKRLHGEKKDSDLSAADHWVTHVLPDLLETYPGSVVDKSRPECCFHVAGFTGSLACPVRG